VVQIDVSTNPVDEAKCIMFLCCLSVGAYAHSCVHACLTDCFIDPDRVISPVCVRLCVYPDGNL